MNNTDKENLLPSLRQLCETELKVGKNIPSLTVAFQFDDNDCLVIPQRENVGICCGDSQIIDWHIDSIRALFRGNKTPPDLEDFPEEYIPVFAAIEQPIADFSDQPELSLSDADFKEIFSAMRRRPDGRRINLMHDLVWQAAALALALHPCSEAEYTAVFTRLEKSARTFNTGHGSKNYLAYLRNTLS
jgi:hypothetical protein